ncbi:hypothetical protein TNCV_1163001 [Trichonephila clavipes]|nr:hypothetical protein TNCV_1163001 [Trichonephila clavipes]
MGVRGCVFRYPRLGLQLWQPSSTRESATLNPTSGKIKLSLQEVLELLESLPSESSNSPTGDSSDEEVLANNLLAFSSDSEVGD